MFLSNKYSKWYFHIVNNAGWLEGIYQERHHIIPKSFGGCDAESNLVFLTPREHFICHWLLTKMVSSPQDKFIMLKAFIGMLGWKTKRNLTPRQYQILVIRSKSVPMSDSTRAKLSTSLAGKTSSRKGKTLLEFYGSQSRVDELKAKKTASMTGKKRSKYSRIGSASSIKCTDGKAVFSSVKDMAERYSVSPYMMKKLISQPDSTYSIIKK